MSKIVFFFLIVFILVKISQKLRETPSNFRPVHESIGVKREAISPNIQLTNRQLTPTNSPAITQTISSSIKQECIDDENINIEQHETVPIPPITSSSLSSSSQSSSPSLSKLHILNNDKISFKVCSQSSKIKHHSNNRINKNETNNDDLNGTTLTNDSSRQIRYYHDRIDFRGDILMKPPAAKSICSHY